jgi:hypothetical protein
MNCSRNPRAEQRASESNGPKLNDRQRNISATNVCSNAGIYNAAHDAAMASTIDKVLTIERCNILTPRTLTRIGKIHLHPLSWDRI